MALFVPGLRLHKENMSAFPGATTPNVGPDYYESSSTWSKEILVTKDPVFVNRTVINGHYIGRKPHNYLPLAIVATILNPLIGPIAIVFASKYNLALSSITFPDLINSNSVKAMHDA